MAATIKEIAGDKYVLWGASWSLYTAKVRPYLIKKGTDYVEICPSHPHYLEHIVPTIGYVMVPVLETPDGDIIADSTEIMEFLEPRFPIVPMLPEDKSLAALAYLIHALLRRGDLQTLRAYARVTVWVLGRTNARRTDRPMQFRK